MRDEAQREHAGRFGAGLPRISDGQLLFLQHIISKFKSPSEGGSEAAVIFNGSPLFTGDAGSGESEIRRWILEKDYLEAIVALPEQLFFNTGISTYIWLLSNRKSAKHKGKVALIDARLTRTQLRRNLGAKRYEISEQNTQEVIGCYNEYKENEYTRIFPTTEFAYREITIQTPLRLMFKVGDESIARLKRHRDFLSDYPSKKSGERGNAESKEWREIRSEIYKILENMRGQTIMSRVNFLKKLEVEFERHNLSVPKKVIKIIYQEIGERDEKAEICVDEDGKPEADNELKDFERVPWGQDVHEYFNKEVKVYAPDSWIDESVRDEKDGRVGIVGYEIPITRYFYKYEVPRDIEEIEREVNKTEEEIQKLLPRI